MNKDLLCGILIIVAVVAVFVYFKVRFKRLHTANVTLVTGGVKTGKSLCCVHMAIKEYKRRIRSWKWQCFKCKLFRLPLPPKPVFYSNAKIYRSYWDKFKYKKCPEDRPLLDGLCMITTDMLLRKTRPAEGCVAYICEASLMADNMDFKDAERNARLSLFNKLFCHETKNGKLYYDTQSILDVHYSIKRVMSSYLFIAKSYALPFIGRVLLVRENINSENGVNSFNNDMDMELRKVFIPWWYYSYYDCFEYYNLTKDLPIDAKEFDKENSFVSFNPLYVKLSKGGDLNEKSK